MNFSVTYNSYVIGGSSTASRQIGTFSYGESDTDAWFSVDFVLFGSTVANYDSAEDSMLTALSEPESSFVVKHGVTTFLSLDPASYQAFDIKPSIVRIPDETIDTDRTKRWRFSVTYTKPPVKSSDGYLSAYSWAVSWTAARLRTVVITGTYTAGGGNTARENYDSASGALFTSTLTTVGGTYKKVREGPILTERRNGTIDFTVEFEEVNYTTGVSGVTNERISFAKQIGVEASPTRFAVTCSYRSEIDRSLVNESSLPATISSVSDQLLSHAKTLFGANVGYIENVVHGVGSSDNSIHLELSMVLAGVGFTYLRSARGQLAYSDSRQKSFSVFGQYSSDGTNNALTKHDADIDAIVSSLFTLFGLTESDFELISEGPTVMDDDAQSLSFIRSYREKIYSTSTSGIQHENLTISRTGAYQHGKSGRVGWVRGRAQYSAVVDLDSITTATGVSSVVNTVRGVIVSRASALYGAAPIIEAEAISVSDTSGAVSADLRLLFPSVSSAVVAYTEDMFASLDDRVSFRPLWDGKPLSETASTPGPSVLLTQTFTQTEKGSVSTLKIPSSPTVSSIVTNGLGASGKWVRVGVPSVRLRKFHIGKDPEGASSETAYITSSVSVVWRNVNLSNPGGVPESGSAASGGSSNLVRSPSR